MTMNKMIHDKKQRGFTLIEIIAVLVLLGILAAVAIPRFIDMQNTARDSALQGVVSAVQSQMAMNYAEELLRSGGDTSSAWSYAIAQCDSGVSTDGFATDPMIACGTGTTHSVISVTSGSNSASGRFSNPGN